MNNRNFGVRRFLIGLLVIFSAGMSLAGCKKDHQNPANTSTRDTIPPVINLIQPYIHELYLNGDTIAFQGKVTDNVAVTRVKVSLYILDDVTHDSTNIYYKEVTPNAASYTFNSKYKVNTTDTLEYHFNVYAEDSSGNHATTDPEDHVHINGY